MSSGTQFTTPPRKSRRGGVEKLFCRREKSNCLAQGSPEIGGCCFPVFRRSKNRASRRPVVPPPEVKQVRFSTEPSTASCLTTPKVLRKNFSLTSKGLKVKMPVESTCCSHRSYVSAVSTMSKIGRLSIQNADINEDEITTVCTDSEGRDRCAADANSADSEHGAAVLCICAAPAHSTFNPSMPLVLAPGVEPGSNEDLMIHAKSIVGNWTSILSRSQSLDPQMAFLGIGKLKRSIMNKLAIPFVAVLAENNTLLDTWIVTPVGNKHSCASLIGKETEDKDGDLGDWTARTSIVNYSISWFCGGKSVRAMQMKRLNPQFGVAYETRIVLPDEAEGKVLLYNTTIQPADGRPFISVDRLLKFSGP